LLVMTLVHWMPLPLVISIFLLITFSAGTVAPGITQGIMEPLPEIAGTVSAATNCVSIMSGALCSGLTTILFDGRSTLSMATVMTICSLLAMAFYLVTTRSAALAALRSRVG
jgi:DHA1 family bicyclomycin/chloramphenicol resistance-like MFS transporter